jgi:hypothetical protein
MRRRDSPWTPFQERWFSPKDEAFLRANGLLPCSVVRNNLFEVWLRPVPASETGWPAMIWLSIKRLDKKPIDRNYWRTMQRIKNELVGQEHDGVELFPAESRLVDTANQYHLWCLADPGMRFPFGFATRLVSESDSHGARQRSWEGGQRPPDLRDQELAAGLTAALRDGVSLVEVQRALDESEARNKIMNLKRGDILPNPAVTNKDEY